MVTTDELIVFNVQCALNDLGANAADKVSHIQWYVDHTYHMAQLRWALINGFPIERLSAEERAEYRDHIERLEEIGAIEFDKGNVA